MFKYLFVSPLIFAFNVFAANPYFVSVSCQSTKIVISQHTQYSFDVTPGIIDTIKDSLFSCNANGCTWLYTIKSIDTVSPENVTLQYSTLDSSYYVDTLGYSFFDAENDSCKFIMAGLDSLGKIVYADSIWGDIASRPSTNKRIYFLHRKPFLKIIPCIIQLSSLSDTVFDTIQYSASENKSNLITDSLFYSNLSGAWQRIFSGQSYTYYGGTIRKGSFVSSPGGYFFDSTEAFAYTGEAPNRKFYKTFVFDTSCNRDGWSIDYFDGYSLETLILLKDTLIIFRYGNTGLSPTIEEVCARDTSIKSANLSTKPGVKAEPNSFAFKILLNSQNHSCIVSFHLEKRSKVNLCIFDLLGRQMSTSFNNTLDAGHYQIPFNLNSLSSKYYICQLFVSGNVQSKLFTIYK